MLRNLVDFGRKLGHVMKIVDVGGGFPGGDHHPSFEQVLYRLKPIAELLINLPKMRGLATEIK